MRRWHLAILAFMTLIAATGCGAQNKSFYPLDEGEKRTYQINASSRYMGSVHATLTSINMRKRDLAGKPVTPQKMEINGQTFFSFVSEDSDGVLELAEQTPNAAEPEMKSSPRYFLRRPYKEGTKWEVRSETQTLPSKVSITLQALIQSTNETVTVPAGTLEGCLKTMAKGDAIKSIANFMGQVKIHVEEISWFCPGVGLAKSIRQEGTNHLMLGNGEVSVQLESHVKS